MHPNIMRKETSGFLSNQASNGVMPFRFVGARLRMNNSVLTASPQNSVGMPFAFIVLRAMSTVWFRRSTTPFCCGEYGAVWWRTTPLCGELHRCELAAAICPQHDSFFPDSASARA
jgi:hypothetical protein